MLIIPNYFTFQQKGKPQWFSKANITTISFLILVFILVNFYANSQVGVGTTMPEPSSALDVSSSNGGMLVPRMLLSQKNSIVNPAQGLTISSIGATEIPLFTYWTSTESFNNSQALAFNMFTGTPQELPKSTSLNIITIRKF